MGDEEFGTREAFLTTREVALDVPDRVACDLFSHASRERRQECDRVDGSSRVERDSSQGSPQNCRASQRYESTQEEQSEDSGRLVTRGRRSRDRRGAR